MKVALVNDRPNQIKLKKRLQYVENSDIKEVKKLCPWAIMTCPHKEGHMAFETVTGYNEWLKQQKD